MLLHISAPAKGRDASNSTGPSQVPTGPSKRHLASLATSYSTSLVTLQGRNVNHQQLHRRLQISGGRT